MSEWEEWLGPILYKPTTSYRFIYGLSILSRKDLSNDIFPIMEPVASYFARTYLTQLRPRLADESMRGGRYRNVKGRDLLVECKGIRRKSVGTCMGQYIPR